MRNENYYKTSDLSLAAALVTLGHQIINLERGDSRRVIFVFEGSEALTKAEQSFWSGMMQVSPKSYFEAIRTVKSRLYAG